MTGAEQIIGLTANATSGAKSSPKTANTTDRGDYDNPWKAMLDKYLPEFLQLLFPDVHAAVDWSCKWRPENVALRGSTGSGRGLWISRVFAPEGATQKRRIAVTSELRVYARRRS